MLPISTLNLVFQLIFISIFFFVFLFVFPFVVWWFPFVLNLCSLCGICRFIMLLICGYPAFTSTLTPSYIYLLRLVVIQTQTCFEKSLFSYSPPSHFVILMFSFTSSCLSLFCSLQSSLLSQNFCLFVCL